MRGAACVTGGVRPLQSVAGWWVRELLSRSVHRARYGYGVHEAAQAGTGQKHRQHNSRSKFATDLSNTEP